MQNTQSRRRFLANTSLAAAAGVLGARPSLADEAPLETTSIRQSFTSNICFAPFELTEPFLRAEGFTDIEWVEAGD